MRKELEYIFPIYCSPDTIAGTKIIQAQRKEGWFLNAVTAIDKELLHSIKGHSHKDRCGLAFAF